MAERILVVEDESTLCTNIARYLSRAGYAVTAVETGRAALAELDRVTFDLVITDLRLPDLDGLAVLDHVRVTSPESFVLIMTAYASIESAVEALRRGAHDYVLKPMSLADLQSKVEHIARYHRLNRENARLRTLLRGDSDAMTLLRKGGREMTDLCDMVVKVAASSANVLLLGESGTGKELVARAMHERSERASGPFVTMNVSAVPDSLVESYLFGHERGAFPGADQAREGLFRAATGGTLFLDEVGELPLPLQAKLLRAVESKEILPVGADRSVHVDTRIVAATHCDLPAMVADGRFRQDLLYRLQVVEVRVPALRDRRGDVAQLAITSSKCMRGRSASRCGPSRPRPWRSSPPIAGRGTSASCRTSSSAPSSSPPATRSPRSTSRRSSPPHGHARPRTQATISPVAPQRSSLPTRRATWRARLLPSIATTSRASSTAQAATARLPRDCSGSHRPRSIGTSRRSA